METQVHTNIIQDHNATFAVDKDYWLSMLQVLSHQRAIRILQDYSHIYHQYIHQKA